MTDRSAKLFSILLLTILSGLSSCGNSETVQLKNEETKRWKEVMANHDVVMPLMGTTNKVRKDLKKLLGADKNLTDNSQATINNLITQLNKADEGMMDWMNNFQQLEKLQKTKTHEEIMQYLAKTDEEIKAVGRAMNKSIQDGLDFLESFGPQ